jgi:hypothetical protein
MSITEYGHSNMITGRRLAKPDRRPDFLTRLTEDGRENEISALQLSAHAADIL